MQSSREIVELLYGEASDNKLSQSEFVNINPESKGNFPYLLILISSDKSYAARISTRRNPKGSDYLDYGLWDSRNAFSGVDIQSTELYSSDNGILTFNGGQIYSGQEKWEASELSPVYSIDPGDTIENLTLRAEHGREGYAESYDSAIALKYAAPDFFPKADTEEDEEEDPVRPIVVNNVTNITNEINNNTTVNITNSGPGNVSVGNIGEVSAVTTVDNSFTLQVTNINLSVAITGESKKSERVEGTDGDDLIADGRGKDKLLGGAGADQFYFAGEELFKKKTVDRVLDFDTSEGDAIVIADEVFGDLTEDPSLAIADTKKDLKQLSRDGYDLLYFEPKGDLYVDGNGDSKGFGKKSEGGMIADLPNDTVLTESDVLIGV